MKLFFGKHGPIFVSAAAHGALFILLAFIAVAPDGHPAATLHVAWSEADEEVIESVGIEAVEIEFAEEGPRYQTELVVSVAEASPVEPELATYSPAMAATGLEITDLDLSTPISTQESALASKANASGKSSGRGNSTSFFGSQASGKQIVFVLDKSGSMQQMMGGKSRLQVLKREIIRSIHSLDEEMMFNVIFFNRQSVEIDSRGLRRATEENKLEIIQWIHRMRFDGDTFPEDALKTALGQRPDGIFFLTDGSFNPAVVETVTKENAEYKIPVFTVGLGDPTGIGLLRALALQNNGTFRFIP